MPWLEGNNERQIEAGRKTEELRDCRTVMVKGNKGMGSRVCFSV